MHYHERPFTAQGGAKAQVRESFVEGRDYSSIPALPPNVPPPLQGVWVCDLQGPVCRWFCSKCTSGGACPGQQEGSLTSQCCLPPLLCCYCPLVCLLFISPPLPVPPASLLCLLPFLHPPFILLLLCVLLLSLPPLPPSSPSLLSLLPFFFPPLLPSVPPATLR